MTKEVHKFSMDKKLSKDYFKHKQVYGKLLIVLAFTWAGIRLCIFLFQRGVPTTVSAMDLYDPSCAVMCVQSIGPVLASYSYIFAITVFAFGVIRLYRYKIMNPRNARLLSKSEPAYENELNNTLKTHELSINAETHTHVKSRKTIKHVFYPQPHEKVVIKINSKTGKGRLIKTSSIAS